MRPATAFTVLLVLCLLGVQACSREAGTGLAPTPSSTAGATEASPTASPSPALPSPSARAASPTPRKPPPPSACKTARTHTAALVGPLAVYHYPDVGPAECAIITMVDRLGHESIVVSASQPEWEFKCPAGFPKDSVGLTPGPAASVTDSNVYWLDGTYLRWMNRNGTQFKSAFAVPLNVGIEFAVSPDDTRIAITEIDFRRSPLHRTTWIEDVGTRTHRSILFNADLTSATSQSPGWPWGWHAGNPVLYDFPLCVVRGGDQYFALNHPRIVDATSGLRLVSFPECYGSTITAGGVLCTKSFQAQTLDWLDWTGRQIKQFALPALTVSCDSDLSPAQTAVLAFCQPNIYVSQPSGDRTARIFLFGSTQKLPAPLAKSRSLNWLDDDLVVDGNVEYVKPGFVTTIAVWSLTSQRRLVAGVDVPGVEIGRLAATA